VCPLQISAFTVFVITGTTQTDITSSFSTSVFQSGQVPNIAANSADQIYLIQGTITSDGEINTGEANYILNGTLLHGLTNQIAWVPLSNACSGATTRESRLPSALNCFNVENTNSNTASSYYQNDKIHTGSIRQLIQGIGNSSNWTNSSDRYTVDISSSATDRAGKSFVVNAGNEPGTWVASSDTNWFNCSNWENLVVPDKETDVYINTISSTVNNEINFNATDATLYNATATCKNLYINGRKLILTGNQLDKIEVYGNLVIDGTGELDMSDQNNTTTDGQLYLYGNWTNNLGETSFKQGNSTVHLMGSTTQNVTCVGTEVEKFYHLFINNDLTTDNFEDKLIAEGNLTINSNKTFTAQAGDVVQVSNQLITTGASVTFENNSSLIQTNNINNEGEINYKRIAEGIKGYDYVYWSSPVTGQDISTIYTNNPIVPQGPKYIWNPTESNTNGGLGNWQAASGTMD
ncbi:MAG: hypothetical protein ACOVOV_16530, partial [Dolichospermum sp.]